MTVSRRTIIMNAFRPAKEVDQPGLFAGRASEVAQLTDALHVIGSIPLIYGDRGLGKTSLAIQTGWIAMGSVELLSPLKIEDRAFSENEQYIVIFVTCEDDTQDFDGLVQLLINEAEKADFAQPQQGYKPRHLTERTTSYKWSFKVFEAENTKRYEHATARPSYQNLSPREKLQHLIGIIVEAYDSPVLFIIDEVDRLHSTKGLASFLKATSSESVKFLLVGIAASIENLLADHQSVERSLVPVQVPLMSDEELRDIVVKAQAYLKENDIDIEFGYLATSAIADSASGFPWFVHVLGQSTLQKAIEGYSSRPLATRDKDRINVLGMHVDEAKYDLSRNQFARRYWQDYVKVVRNSPNRETVLRAFASWRARDIPTSEVYKVLRAKLGIRNPSAYRTQLASHEYDRVIHTVHGRNSGWVNFTNEIFKVYIRLIPSIHPRIDNSVEDAFRDMQFRR